MVETAKTSKPRAAGVCIGGSGGGIHRGVAALDASQSYGRYWPIHVVSGPVFTLANFAHETHSAVLTFLGTGLLFGVYTWCATTFRSLAMMVVIALVHLGLAAGGVAMATQAS